MTYPSHVPRLLLVVATFLFAACGVDEPTTPTTEATPSGDLTEVLPAPTTDTIATTTPEAEAESTTSAPTTSSTTTTSTTTTTTTIPQIPTVALGQVALDLDLDATFTSPVGMAPRPGSDDLFVIEQQGRVIRLPNGASDGADTTLDLRGQVSGGNEQGLLGLAFSPDGERLYVDFTDRSGDTTIVRYDMAGTIADVSTAEVLLTVPQPRGNHNGGGLAFGPDGYLYIGMGDGGGGGDPFAHGQNPDTLHGAVLRIDVSPQQGYVVPPDNPFLSGGAPEVFAWGIRNAWRFGFDSVTGDLWIGDVGQDRFEEVTVLRSADGAGNGANLGWNAAEGTESFRGAAIPDGHVAPVITYGHANNRCSITGGEVYRGSAIPELYGTYLYGDFCSGEVFGYRVDDQAQETRLDIASVNRPSSFALDNDGEIYVLSRAGGVFRISAR